MRQLSAERITRAKPRATNAVLELENGAHMDQKTFHKLYEQTPEGFQAQLIGGIVYVMASPVSLFHGEPHANLVALFAMFKGSTEGVRVGDNTTSILGAQSEPQSDAFLMIRESYGGQSRVDRKGIVRGAPELVAEVAHSSTAIDLNRKKLDYEEAGVQEYFVVVVRERTVHWFIRQGTAFVDHPIGADGIFRSRVMPGLWLKPKFLFSDRTRSLISTLNRGLASPEHAAFVKELAARKKKTKPKSRKKK